MKRLLLSVVLYVIPNTALSGQRPSCPAIEVAIVADAQSGSTRSAVFSDGTRIQLTNPPLLTSAAVTGARTSLTEGVYVLNLDVAPDTGKRIQAFSQQNVGRSMAFIIDGRVISTPKIKDPITGNGILIGPFGRDEAERLAPSDQHWLCGL
jgi:preprotein translocase subunit SecD